MHQRQRVITIQAFTRLKERHCFNRFQQVFVKTNKQTINDDCWGVTHSQHPKSSQKSDILPETQLWQSVIFIFLKWAKQCKEFPAVLMVEVQGLCWRTRECFWEDIFSRMNDKPVPLLRPFKRLSCSFAHTLPVTPPVSQARNSLEKYDRCYSHALCILSMRFLWRFISQAAVQFAFLLSGPEGFWRGETGITSSQEPSLIVHTIVVARKLCGAPWLSWQRGAETLKINVPLCHWMLSLARLKKDWELTLIGFRLTCERRDEFLFCFHCSIRNFPTLTCFSGWSF